MRRLVTQFLPLLSALLFLGVVALWAAGLFEPVQFGTSDQRDLWWALGSHEGRLSFGRMRRDDPALGGRPGAIGQAGRWGFYSGWSYWMDPNGLVPCWALAIPLAVLPGISVSRGLRHRRKKRMQQGGLCVHCGYDLRATPGRCPECGAAAGLRRGGSVKMERDDGL